jgi:uncharacterized protein YciI
MMAPLRLLALHYDYVPDILERRGEHRDAHLAHIHAWEESGRLLVAGALGDPPRGAIFGFDLDDPQAVEEFAAADPYVRAGLVTDHRIEPWTVVAGGLADPKS